MLRIVLEALHVIALQYGYFFDGSCHNNYAFNVIMGDKTATEQFSSLLAAKVQILYEKRRRLRVKSDERRAFSVTFVLFLMGIVLNNHKKTTMNKTIWFWPLAAVMLTA